MSIVIAVDESEMAATIVQAVAPSLRRSQATAYLFTVVDPAEAHGRRRSAAPAVYLSETTPVDPSGGALPRTSRSGPELQPVVEDRGQALASLEDDRRHQLDHLADAHLAGVTHEVRVQAGEDVATTIAAFADEIGADTIAIGTHGRSGLGRAPMGSLAEALIRSSSVPVLVVHDGMRVAAG